MRVYTEIVIDMRTNAVLKEEFYEYEGPIALCKGDGEAKAQLREQTALQKDAYNRMKAQQDKVDASVKDYITGSGVGFDPTQLALMRSQFLNQNAMNYDTAGANLRSALLRRGSAGSDSPVGGDYVKGVAALEGGLASDRSSGLANIDLSNLQQALTNKFNSLSLMNGQAAQMTSPISTFGSGASNALNQYVYASNQGFGNAFTSALGKSLGQGIGSIATSAMSGGFNNLTGMKTSNQ